MVNFGQKWPFWPEMTTLATRGGQNGPFWPPKRGQKGPLIQLFKMSLYSISKEIWTFFELTGRYPSAQIYPYPDGSKVDPTDGGKTAKIDHFDQKWSILAKNDHFGQKWPFRHPEWGQKIILTRNDPKTFKMIFCPPGMGSNLQTGPQTIFKWVISFTFDRILNYRRIATILRLSEW